MKEKKILLTAFLIAFVIAFLLSLLAVACFLMIVARIQRTYDYSFSQPLDQVEKVEIRKYDYDTSTTTPLLVLDESQANALLAGISSLPCKRHFGDRTMDYGEAVVYITYANGEAEVIGIWNVATVDVNGEWSIGGEYFGGEELPALLLQYVPELQPELQKYLE